MLKLEVCIGSACHIKGSYNVISVFQQIIEENHWAESVELCAVFCMGHCTKAVSVRIGERIYSVQGATAKAFFEKEVVPKLEP